MSGNTELFNVISKIWMHARSADGKQILFGISPADFVELEDLWYSPLGRKTNLTMFGFFSAMLRDELQGRIITEYARHHQFSHAWKEYAKLRRKRECASACSRVSVEGEGIL